MDIQNMLDSLSNMAWFWVSFPKFPGVQFDHLTAELGACEAWSNGAISTKHSHKVGPDQSYMGLLAL